MDERNERSKLMVECRAIIDKIIDEEWERVAWERQVRETDMLIAKLQSNLAELLERGGK